MQIKGFLPPQGRLAGRGEGGGGLSLLYDATRTRSIPMEPAGSRCNPLELTGSYGWDPLEPAEIV